MRVHIDDLVLHGFPAHSGRKVGEGLVAELTHLFASHGVPRPMLAMHGTERAHAESIEPLAARSRLNVGERIARSLYGLRP